MSQGTFLSWDEMQHLALPPNSAMLIPPTPDPLELAELSAGVPEQRPDWLDDAFQGEPKVALNEQPNTDAVIIDPDANRAAAERAEYGDPAVRLLANLIAMNAALEYAQTPPKEEDEEKKQVPLAPKPDEQ
jgi:hypothetical protein